MIRLYGQKTSRAQRCLWMLHELALDFDHVPTHFDGESKQPEYLALNPNGKVPTLVDGQFRLFESMAINLYLAKRYGKGTPMALETLEDEALATQWSFWVVTEVEQQLLTYLNHHLLYPAADKRPERAEEADRLLQRPYAVLEAELGKQAYLSGPEFGVADLAVASVLAWAKMARYPFDGMPRLKAWLDRCVKREAALRARA